MSESTEDRVYLHCLKIDGKLRVRITSPAYKADANSQFPRAIRKNGAKWSVRPSDITLIKRGSSYFYSIKVSNLITLLEGEEVPKQIIKNKIKRIYNTEDDLDCLICLDNSKDSVFNSCGHYVCCKTCASKVNKCPMCRQPVLSVIDYNDLK
jgi:uncharacterized protein YggU (UPF0235/DUF167 family)